MRRFDYDDNEDHREEVDKFFGGGEPDGEGDVFMTPEEYEAIRQENAAMQQASFDIVYRELDDRLLFRVVKMLERSFWWRFYSLDTRMKMIEKSYRRMKKINEKG